MGDWDDGFRDQELMNDLNLGEVCVRIGYTGKKNKKHLNQYC